MPQEVFVRRFSLVGGTIAFAAIVLMFCFPEIAWFAGFTAADLIIGAGYGYWYGPKSSDHDEDAADRVFGCCQLAALAIGFAAAWAAKGFLAGIGCGILGWLLFLIPASMCGRGEQQQRA